MQKPNKQRNRKLNNSFSYSEPDGFITIPQSKEERNILRDIAKVHQMLSSRRNLKIAFVNGLKAQLTPITLCESLSLVFCCLQHPPADT